MNTNNPNASKLIYGMIKNIIQATAWVLNISGVITYRVEKIRNSIFG